MKLRLGMLALASLMGGSSVAQTPPAEDPLLCTAVQSILGKAGPNGWDVNTNPTLAFDGGELKCTSIPSLKKMSCKIASLQTCADKRPTAEESAETGRLYQYAVTRGVATLASCLKGRTLQPYGGKTEFDGYVSMTKGNEYKEAGKPTVRLLQFESRSITETTRCQDQALSFDFLVE